MSRTVFISYHDRELGAFDVVTNVLLKNLIDVAAARACDAPWLANAVDQWRVHTITADLGFHLDESWSRE